MNHRRTLDHPARRALQLFLAVVLGCAAFLTSTQAFADDDKVSWSARPSSATEADGRRWIELDLNPGDKVNDHLSITNFGKSAITFTVYGADGYFTSTGRFNMRTAAQKSTGAGLWITVQPTAKVEPGQTVILPFSVTVPADATPGDHAAGIAVGFTSKGTAGGTNLGVESRVGFRVMTRVKGEVKSGFSVTTESSYDTNWNPFAPGSMRIKYTVVNGGNVRLSLDGSVQHAGIRTPTAGSQAAKPFEMLPLDQREVELVIPGVWPLFSPSVQLTVNASTLLPDGSTEPLQPVTVNVSALAIPWPQILMLVALGLIIFGLAAGRARQKRKLADMLAKAKEEGRREASVDDPDDDGDQKTDEPENNER